MDAPTMIALGTPLVGVVAYIVQLKGRVDGHDTILNKEEEFRQERQDATDARLTRMETKLDQVLAIARRP